MSDSGAPKHWPFEVVEPADFKVPDRVVKAVWIREIARDELKQELVELLNEYAILDGWHGIGFHFVIDKLGNVCKARPLDEVAQIGDEKQHSIAIICVPSNAGCASRDALCESIKEAYELARKKMVFHYE